MEENDMGVNIYKKKNNEVKIIRISKEFSGKGAKPENIMFVNKGGKKIQHTLNNKISQRSILISLKTIQSNPIYDEDSKVYYSSLPINKINRSRQSIYHQRRANAIKKIYSKDSKNKKEEENTNKDIYNLDIDINKRLKENKDSFKRKTYNWSLIKDKNESYRSLKNEGKSSNINSDINVFMNKTVFAGDKKNKNNIQKRNNQNMVFNLDKIKKVMTINNIQSINHINFIENNNDKISKLSNLKSNKLLYEKENTNSNSIDNVKAKEFDKSCFLCERLFVFPNIYFAKCRIHYFCRNCLKVYCHELITKGFTKIKCPIFKCKYEFDNVFLKKILDEDCYNILFGNKSEENIDKKTLIGEPNNDILIAKFNNDKIDSYNHNKNVIDINSNLTLYKVRKSKDEYCPNCHEHSLFRNNNLFFYKCLNCGNKICKYCNKKFTSVHMVFDDPSHCKVYQRRKKKSVIKNKYHSFLMQLIYTFGMFVIFLAYCFLFIKKFFLLILGFGNKNYLKIIFSYFLSFCIYLIILPILIIFIPFFPNIVTLTEGY